jgi:hypothetical protein
VSTTKIILKAIKKEGNTRTRKLRVPLAGTMQKLTLGISRRRSLL